MNGKITDARKAFHKALLGGVLNLDDSGVASNADRHNALSVSLAKKIIDHIEGEVQTGTRVAGQVSGSSFEDICKAFIETTFSTLGHLRPGKWTITKGGGRSGITQFEQYRHLGELEKIARTNPEVATVLGSDYLIKPDIIIARSPESDDEINRNEALVDESSVRFSSLRAKNNLDLILHGSISCKWTIRSDRAQNARSEALNLVRNRKGLLPHIVVITAEPTPSRIASIALGTGDLDCVYHFALPELQQSLTDNGVSDAKELLDVMVNGRRLRDISDLPLDLAI